MLKTRFGIEIEFTGVTRLQASHIINLVLNGSIERASDGYDTYKVIDNQNRAWKIMYDGSIRSQIKENRIKVAASSGFSVELVSPILTYENDIETLQNIIRALRKGGAFANSSCGIHIHLDGKNHNARSIRNFINIIASKNDLIYKALEVKEDRIRYCKKMDNNLVAKINKEKPTTLSQIKDIWYDGYCGPRTRHYHDSRYHFLNLHSFFTNNHTVELRGFNSELHAGKIRTYILLALALNNQALTSKATSTKKPQVENEKYAMRTYLNRLGLIGDDYKNCRLHLTKPLSGSSAWRHSAPSAM